MNKKNPLLKNTSGNQRDHIGFGYIVIPLDVDRNEFIEHCLNTNTATVITDYEVINNVYIIEQCIDKIEFPAQSTVENLYLGSQVIFVNDMNHNHPVIIGTVNRGDKVKPNLKENEHRVHKQSNDNNTSINSSFQPENGTILLNLNSFNKDTTFIINVNGKEKGSFTCNTNNEISFKTNEFKTNVFDGYTFTAKAPNKGSKASILGYKVGSGLSYTDEFDNSLNFKEKNVELNSDNTTINTDKFKINKGSEPNLLGNKTVDLLNKLISACEKITVSSFGAPPNNLAEFTLLKLELETLKSSVVFID